jgi:hypothetical protein
MQFLRRGTVSNNEILPGAERVVYVETTAGSGTSGSPAFLAGGKPLGIVSTSILLPGGLPLPAGELGVIPGEQVNALLREAKVRP